MAQSGSQNIGFRLDINQILSEAQHRWLRPAEICEILRNYQKFHVTPEPPHLPISGSVFLFDRKVLRYFRKDGHIWRKKKDGKTVKEAHEKLKVGSVDMLHCYYAHGEQNENFQRRSYWMLEPDLMHIVFVHYLDVKGNKTHSTSLLDTESLSTSSHNDSSFSSSPAGDNVASTYTDMTSPTSTLTSAYEDAECVQPNRESNHHAYSRYNSYLEAPQGEVSRGADNLGAVRPNSYNLLQSFAEYIPIDPALGNGQCNDGCFVPGSQGTLDLESWGDVLGNLAAGESAGIHGSWNLPEPHAIGKGQINHYPISSAAYDSRGNLVEHKFLPSNLQKSADQLCIGPDGIEEDNVNKNHKKLLPSSQVEYLTADKTEKDLSMTGNGNCPPVLKQSHLSGLQLEDGLKKVDSFSRWMTKELGEVNDLQLQPNNTYSWNEIETDDVDGNSCMPGQLQLDSDTLNFSLSQDQLFSISDFSPNWAYCNSGTEVLITGRFLKSGQVFHCKWSCMFGEVEVPAKVLADGVLCCLAPPHKAGLVPFYITCSNRVACSEVREFEYRPRREDINETRALKRLDMLISRRPIAATGSPENFGEKRDLVTKIMSLMEEDNNMSMKFLSGDNGFVCGSLEELQGQELWKDKFFSWLLQIVTEEGKGPTVLDEEGQGVLHLAAALGFNWALKPITASGVSIDFRDINGWTALHWAAFCGREDTVAALVSLGAASGALTDPCAEYPLGRTPADLASANGYKGISGFLAECSLTSHLKLLNVEDSADDNVFNGSGAKAVQTISERLAAPPTSEEDVPDTLTLKDSLAAVRNATQAAARIHQIFRIHSFQRKMLNTQGGDEPSSSDECALSLLATRKCRLGQHDSSTHTAATQIQKKFRGWKKRKEFLIIRERIVKIQAHVRGHQARKKYKPIIWSVGILEKVILRWRRKGSGLRGFQGPSTQETPVKEGDDDVLKEGRKQSEERMHKALTRVKSMVQYPEARAQYRRLLNVAEGLRETEDNKSCSAVPSPSEPECSQYPDEYLIDVEHLFDDDAFMAMAMD